MAGFKLGTTDVSNVKLGNSQVTKVMAGSVLVWEHTAPITYTPLTVYTNNGATCGLGFTSSTIYKKSDDNLYYTSTTGTTLVNGKYFATNNSTLGADNTANLYENGAVCSIEILACNNVDQLMICF